MKHKLLLPVILTSLTLLPGSFPLAQGPNAIELVAGMIPLAEGAQAYCESVQPGAGAAIARAVAALKRGQDEYVAWMVKQPIYQQTKKMVADDMPRDPAAFLRRYGPESSCEKLPQTLAAYQPFLAGELASPQWQEIKKLTMPSRW